MGVFNLPSSLSLPKLTKVVEATLALQVSGNVSAPLDTDANRAYFTIYNPSMVDVYIDFSTAANPTAPTANSCSYILKSKSTYVSDFPYYTGKVVLACAAGTPSVIVRAFYES